MKFNYKKYGRGVLRPVIPIEVRFGSKSMFYDVLIDSGADFCVFDGRIADILGIKLDKSKKQMMVGITGKAEPYYSQKVTIVVGGWSHTAEVGFKPNLAGPGYGVVGQKGFFDNIIALLKHIFNMTD